MPKENWEELISLMYGAGSFDIKDATIDDDLVDDPTAVTFEIGDTEAILEHIYGMKLQEGKHITIDFANQPSRETYITHKEKED